MKLHLENMGPINEANININKITIVGGHNATGKSTLSKFLYSFLRSNSFNRQEIAYESISKLMRSESRYIRRIFNKYGIEFRYPLLRVRNADVFERLLERYEDMKNFIYESDISEQDFDDIKARLNVIDDLIDVVEKDSDELYISLMRMSRI